MTSFPEQNLISFLNKRINLAKLAKPTIFAEYHREFERYFQVNERDIHTDTITMLNRYKLIYNWDEFYKYYRYDGKFLKNVRIFRDRDSDGLASALEFSDRNECKYILTKDGELCDMHGKLIAKPRRPFENIRYICNKNFIIHSSKRVSILSSVANENVNELMDPLLFDKETRILVGLGKGGWCKIITLQNPLREFNPVYQAEVAIILPDKTIGLVGRDGSRLVDLSGGIAYMPNTC